MKTTEPRSLNKQNIHENNRTQVIKQQKKQEDRKKPMIQNKSHKTPKPIYNMVS